MSLHFTETFDKYFTTSGSLLCLRIRTERLEFSSASFVETAEHLVIFKSEYLDTNDQALKTAYENISKNDCYPVRVSILCTCQHQYNLHHSCMADCISSDTHKGKRVGEVAQKDLEHLEKSLDNKHSHTAV